MKHASIELLKKVTAGIAAIAITVFCISCDTRQKDRFCKTNQSYMKSEIWPGGDEQFSLQTTGLLGSVTLTERR